MCYPDEVKRGDQTRRVGERGDRRDDLLRGAMQRFDFQIELTGEPSADGRVSFKLIPDPRRYDRIEEGGEVLYVDRHTRIAVSMKTLIDCFNRSEQDVKSFFLPARIDDKLNYSASRLDAVRHELRTGEHQPPTQRADAHRPLQLHEKRPVTFLSVDVCGATRMRAESPDGFDRAFDVTFQELAATVGMFYGAILKATGDGFIAFVDHPSVTARDGAVDLGLTLLAVLRDAVNPALAEAGLPQVAIRVGADHGMASIKTRRSAATGFETSDVVSDALNRAVKLQEAAEPGTLLIGEALREQLHVSWIDRTRAARPAIADQVGIPGYRAFEVL